MSFTEFKVALRSFEETEKCQQPSASGVTDRVMTAQPTLRTRSNNRRGQCDYVLRVWESRDINPTIADRGKKRWCANCKSAPPPTPHCMWIPENVCYYPPPPNPFGQNSVCPPNGCWPVRLSVLDSDIPHTEDGEMV